MHVLYRMTARVKRPNHLLDPIIPQANKARNLSLSPAASIQLRGQEWQIERFEEQQDDGASALIFRTRPRQ